MQHKETSAASKNVSQSFSVAVFDVTGEMVGRTEFDASQLSPLKRAQKDSRSPRYRGREC